LAVHALSIKYKGLKTWGLGLFPFMLQSFNGDQYLGFGNSALVINLAGIRETAETLYKKNFYEDEAALKFSVEALKYSSDFAVRTGKKVEKRLLLCSLPFAEACERLARMDIEKYGVSKVRFLGTREKPYYSAIARLELKEWEKALKILAVEKDLSKLLGGGSLTVLELGDASYAPSELLSTTRKLVENYEVEFLAYNRNLTYCVNCRKSFFGVLHKCPSCGAVSTLTSFSRHP